MFEQVGRVYRDVENLNQMVAALQKGHDARLSFASAPSIAQFIAARTIQQLRRELTRAVANNDAPFNTFKEMVDYIAANPKTVKFGSTGPGGLPSVVTVMLSTEVDLDVITVPYDGDGPALTALQGGAIDVMPAVLGAAI